MRIKGKILTVLLISCSAGAGSFYVTRSLEEESNLQDQSMQQWLDLSEQQNQAVQKTTPNFNATVTGLSMNYQNERQKLVRLMSAPDSTDQQISDQVENVIQANGSLFRCVVGYVLSVRRYLTPRQHRRLMQLCNDVISGRVNRQFFRRQNISPRAPGRGPGLGPGPGPGMERRPGFDSPPAAAENISAGQGTGRGQRAGRGQRRGQDQGMGLGQRRGQGQGRGAGLGRGQIPENNIPGINLPAEQRNRIRSRIRGNFARRIGFETQQLEKINQLDPEFDQQSFLMSRQLQKYYQQLAMLLENPDTPDEDVWQHLEKLFQLRNQLDRLIARYVLLIRPHLTPQQLNTLLSLSNW